MSSARRTSTRRTRVAAATGATGLLTLGLSLGLAGAASAHVSVTPSDTAAGSYTVLTFSVPHGCDGSPTTKVAISIPEGINAVTATRNPFYDLASTTETLTEPLVSEDGSEVTERTSTVTYAATTPLPDGERDTFELSLQLPEDATGTSLAFPVIQTCAEGETAWTEVPAEGQTEDDLEHPAPALEVTEVDAGGHGGSAEAEESEESGDAAQVSAGTDSGSEQAAATEDDGNGLAIAGLVTGVLGILVAAVALARTRRTA